MSRSQLILRLHESFPDMQLKDIESAVALIFELISEALENGRRVEIRGFGAFTIRHRDPRAGRNPRTGETVEISADAIPFFRTGKELRTRINGGIDP